MNLYTDCLLIVLVGLVLCFGIYNELNHAELIKTIKAPQTIIVEHNCYQEPPSYWRGKPKGGG